MKHRRAIGRVTIAVFGIAVALLLAWPLPGELLDDASDRSTIIADRHGEVLYEVRQSSLGLKHQTPLSRIPPAVTKAFLAIEDRRFYAHPGVDPIALVRAALQNIRYGKVISGGSTISQQLVRNVVQLQSRDPMTKAYEAYLALRIELFMSKDDIVEAYMNTAYFGQQAYGIRAAAQTFFAKELHELSLAETALLVGLVQSPSAYNPRKNFAAAKARQQRVLQAMLETGAITQSQHDDALQEPLQLSRAQVRIRAPHFVFWLLQRHPELSAAGTTVRTTLDLGLQTQVERIVAKQLSALSDANVTSAAVVVLDAHNGDVLAMVGSADYFDEENDGAVNVATAARQPGSALKPFVYALAMHAGDTAATTVADVEAQFFTEDGNPYIPRNYDYGYHGLVRYREALANSYNIAAVKTLERIGVQTLQSFLTRLGINTLQKSPEHYGLALALGAGEVRLLELAEAYAMLARGGTTLRSRGVLAVPVFGGERVLDERIAWLITDILADNAARTDQFGTNSPLHLPFPAAAKTGTTRNSRDNWTIGYTADRIVGVWVGNADNSPMRGTTGITGAGPIYHDVMQAAVRGTRPALAPKPSGIVTATICRLSGKLATPECPETLDEHFIEGTEPKQQDDLYQKVAIDKRNGLLASKECDPAFVVDAVYAIFPTAVRKWARENGWKQPPSIVSPLCANNTEAQGQAALWLEIVRPQQHDAYEIDPLVPDEHERVILEARASSAIRSVEWHINGKRVGTGVAPDFHFGWQPSEGMHTVQAVSGNTKSTVHSFTVQRRGQE